MQLKELRLCSCMVSLYLLIPIAIIFTVVASVLYFWSAKSGQYDDLDNEGQRILFDDHTGAEKSD